VEAPSNWAPQPPAGTPPPAQPGAYYIGANNHKKGMPPWLGAVLAIAVLGGGFFALYKYVGSRGATGATAALPAAETSGDPAIAGHPFRKHIEIAALRLIEKDNKTMLRFAVVNHSAADLPGLGLRVTLATTAPGDPPLAVFDAKAGDLAAYSTKDLELEIKTGKRVYELPDWQFLKASFEITAPAQ